MQNYLMEIAGLWLNVDKNGNKFMSGKLNDNTRIYIYRNNFKTEGSNQPAYKVYLSPIVKKEEKSEGADSNDDLLF